MTRAGISCLHSLSAWLLLACGDDGIITEGPGLDGVLLLYVSTTATISPQMIAENPWAQSGRASVRVHLATFTRPTDQACDILRLSPDSSSPRWTEFTFGAPMRVPTDTLDVAEQPPTRGAVPTERFTMTVIAHDRARTQTIVGQTTLDYASAECQSDDDFDCLRTVTCGDGQPCISGVFPDTNVVLDTAFVCD